MHKLVLSIAICGIALAAPRPIELKDYYRMEAVSAPALSPDGRKVAFVRTRMIEAENKRHSEIWIAPSDGSTEPIRVSDPAVSATSPHWSSDGKLLSYVGGGSQWFLRVDDPGGKPFHIPGVSGPPVFSPD